MTLPSGLDGATIASIPLGEVVGRSWILLGGLLPIDYDDLRLTELEKPNEGQTRFRFQERSRTAAFAAWGHERIVEAVDEGECTVTDRLEWEMKPLLARVPGAGRLAAAIVGGLFRHRHRRLARRWRKPG